MEEEGIKCDHLDNHIPFEKEIESILATKKEKQQQMDGNWKSQEMETFVNTINEEYGEVEMIMDSLENCQHCSMMHLNLIS